MTSDEITKLPTDQQRLLCQKFVALLEEARMLGKDGEWVKASYLPILAGIAKQAPKIQARQELAAAKARLKKENSL